MIDFSKLTFSEHPMPNGCKEIVGSITIRGIVHKCEGDTKSEQEIRNEIGRHIMRGVYGEIVPPIVRLKQFAQNRVAFNSDAAELLALSNEIDAILLGDPSLNKPVEKSPIIKLRR